MSVPARQVVLNGQLVTRPHALDCAEYGPCSDPTCDYLPGHPELRAAKKEREKVAKLAVKKKEQEQAAALAGMKPPVSLMLDEKLNNAMANANMSRYVCAYVSMLGYAQSVY